MKQSVTGSFSASHGTITLTLYLGYSGILHLWLTKPLKKSFANRPFPETFGPKLRFLASCLSKSPHISTLPVKPTRYVLIHTGAQKSLSYSQEEMADRTCRLLTEKKQPTFYLVCFSVLEAFPGKITGGSRLNSNCSPFQGYQNFCILYHVCAEDLTPQQGRASVSGPSLTE